ncbi:hypothetical protein FHG66_06675 [Rubellimicrobium rubrum]|uniref:DUF2059 domain-containing protein n=2 Tax=Rubellimicrobium rubrum TaxID=2585369 RepID=A0A5C4N343_9RHOB|nr:hypothetical protein FHG66_06675 [Rubellimicrobium rubrum]
MLAMSIRTAGALVLVLGAAPVLAQSVASEAATDQPDPVEAIYEALLLPQVIDLMAEEGREYGETLAESLFGGGTTPAEWSEAVATVYDENHLADQVLDSLATGLEGQDTSAMLAFLESENGRRVSKLEVDARTAMLDDDVEQQAKEAAAVAIAEGSPRIDLLRRYAETNDLVDTNVAGAMNANVAYFLGLMDGGALNSDMTEDDILSGVWAQEAQIRADTTEWVYSFLLKAYEPASDEDIQAYLEFSETEPGRALNRAVFDAFDQRLVDVSRKLGLVAARYLTTAQL